MGLSGSAPARAFALLLILVIAGISGARGNRLLAQQEPAPPQRWDGLIELISGRYPYPSPTTDPQIPADGPSEMSRHAISGDGRYIIFTANAPSLGYSTPALYLRDRRTGDTRVLLGGPALDAVISDDGNHIAFKVCDPWMRPDLLPICDVYALDQRSWAWTLISQGAAGEPGDADSGEPAISADGRFVVYQTSASNILGASGVGKQLVLRDRDPDQDGNLDEPGTSVNERISVNPIGDWGNGDSATAEISDDGRFVAFRSIASTLPGPGRPGVWNVFRRDRQSQRTTRINLRPDGSAGNYSVTSPAIAMSADGSVVAFTSADPFLAGPNDMNNDATDVFVFDANATPSIKRIDIGDGWPMAQGLIPGNGPAEWPSISADGRYVAFQSAASNAAVSAPPPPGSTQVYVFDRATGTPTRISVKPDGTDPDADSVRPQITRDGSLVTFLSQALNLSRNVQIPLDRVYAAVHLEITPAEVTVPGSGGEATFTVTTQQHTQWWIDWTQWYDWISFQSPPIGVGPGTLSVKVGDANPEPVRRTAEIRIHERTAKLTQLEGLSMTSVAPASGPSAGGTDVTIRGTGFEPGMVVRFDGLPAPSVEVVDSTTIVATTPAHETGTVWVAVFSADLQRAAWLDQAFRFLDGTPPEIWSWINGNLGGDGWYTSDATVNWWPWDEETPVFSASGCVTTNVTADTAGTMFTCSATSEGGTSSSSVTVKRDATPPEIQIVTPARTIYGLNSTVTPELICNDPMSGVAQCGEVPSPTPIYTGYSGWQTYTGFGLDKAGNLGFNTSEYAVSTGLCTPVTPGLKLWFEFDASTKDSIHGSPVGGSWPQYAAPEFVPGMVGQALALTDWRFFNFNHQLDDVSFSQAMTFAAWVRADGEDGEAGVIASKEDQFRIARFADGTIRWAFNNTSSGYTWVNTNAVMPKGVWTHLAVTYDNGVVKTYLNGRLVHTHQGSGPIEILTGLPFWGRWLSLGNRHDPAHKSALIGAIDEVQFLDVAWNDAAVDALFFAGPDGMCRLTPTVTLAAFSTTTFGSSSYQARAQLRVASTQVGLPGRTVRLVSYVSPNGVPVGTVTAVTDADGWATWDAPMRPTAPVSTYASGFRVFFDSDLEYGGSTAIGEVTVQTATPVVTWPTPEPITYGTPLSTAHLNATANVPGVFWYSHASGTVLQPGSHALSVTFDPDNWNYRNATASVTLVVTKLTPSLTWNQPAAIVYGTALGASHLNATSNVPGTWSYTPDTGTLLSAGAGQTLTATFTPTDTAHYESASITTTVDVLRAIPTLTWTQPAPIVYGTSLSPSIFAATSSVPGTFTYAPESGTLLNAGHGQTLTATFVPADATNYNGGSVSTTIDVAKATPSVLIAGGSYGYDGTAHPANAAAMGVFGEDLTPLTFSYNGSSSAPVNAGTYEAVATYAGNQNYANASAAAAITIAKAPVGLNWTSPGAIVYGTPLAATHLNATANVPGTFTYSPVAGTVLHAATAQTLTATFTPADPVNYDGGVVTTTIGVAKATPTVTVGGGSFTYDGTPHAATGSVTGVGGESLGPLAITYNGSTTAPANAGNYLVSASYAGSANYEGASATATLTIGKAQAVITWPAPAAIVYGMSLGAAQLNASANAAGSFSYAPAPGTVLNAGNGRALSVVFTPADAANYVGGSASTTIDVQRAPLAVRANDALKPFGAPVPAFVASAAGFVNGDSFASLGGAIAFATTASQASPVGMYPIVPSGVTSANYAITFVAGALSVVRGSTAVSLASSPSPSGNTEPMTFTATVAALAPAAGEPTGTVRFFDGTTLIGSAQLAGGQASLTTAGLDPGIRTIEARYDGDGSFEPSTQSVPHLVQNAAGTPSMTLSSSRNPSNVGQTITLTANVSLGGGSTGGTIEFYDGATLIGSSAISAGRATLTTSALAAASHAITARYTGLADVPPSRSAVFVQAVGASGWKNRATTMTLASSANPSVIDAPVVFTADVTGSSGSMPNGRILFMVNGQVVGDPSGVAVTPLSGSTARATVTVTGLKHGLHKVTATYLGDPTYKGSTALVTQTVN